MVCEPLITGGTANGAGHMIIGSKVTCGNIAGLQLKCSRNLKAYVAPKLRTRRYIVPVVCFNFNDDFDDLAKEFSQLYADRLLVRGRSIDPALFETLKEYESLINWWVRHDDYIDGLVPSEIPSTIKAALLKSN